MALERELNRLDLEVSRLEKGQDSATTSLERLQLKKKANAARLDLRRKRDDMFLGKIRLELELEEQLQRIQDDSRMTATVTRQFTVQVRGNTR